MKAAWLWMAALALVLTAAGARADSRGKILGLSDSWETSESGEPIGIIRVEIQRPREQDISRLRVKLDVQVKDAAGVTRFGTAASVGIGTWARGGATVVNRVLLFKVKPGRMDKPRLSYVATLIDAVSESVVDTKTRGVSRRSEWDMENATAQPLQVQPVAVPAGPGWRRPRL